MRNLRTLVPMLMIWVIASFLAGLNAPSPIDAGFWTGMWHGLVLPGTLALSFIADFQVYAAQNTGLPYILGFAIGVAEMGTFAAFIYVMAEKIINRIQR